MTEWWEVEVRLHGQENWRRAWIPTQYETEQSARDTIEATKAKADVLYIDAAWRVVRCTREVIDG